MPNIDIEDTLSGLTDAEREEVLKILKEYADTGVSESFSDIVYKDYDEIPVNIETFLHDPEYLGTALTDAEGRFTLFPYWEDLLKKLYPDPLKPAQCNTLALTGAIGLGKSTEAVIIGIYELYRMLCLKDPYVYYGLQPIDMISFAVINITLQAAAGVAWSKLQNLIQMSPWFMAHGTVSKSDPPEWKPPKGIELLYGSQTRHIIGRAIFWAFTDEISFIPNQSVDEQREKAQLMVSTATARMQSRFMRNNVNPTIFVLASSKRSTSSFMETFIENKKKNDSKTTWVVDEPQWVIRPDKQSDTTFKVAIGNRFLDSEVVPLNATEDELREYTAKGYTLMDVPIGYYENFIDDINIALTDIAGVSTSSVTRYFSGPRLQAVKKEGLQNLFTKDIITVGNAQDDLVQYYDFIDLDRLDRSLLSKPMYIHLDMSMTGDKTGIAGVWIVGKKPSTDGQPTSKDLFYRLAFSVSVKAPKGHQVSFEKNRQFIRWLRNNGFNIKGCSCFTGDTLVATPHGPIKIKDLKIGDNVYSYDDELSKKSIGTIYNAVNNGKRDRLVKVWYSDSDYIECTPEHPIKTNRGYILAKDITTDDFIEIDDVEFYRFKLLRTGYFIDNEYFSEYISLVIANRASEHSGYTERHHIIPVSMFNDLGTGIDNTDINLVRVSYCDHIRLHYLLLKCTVDKYSYKMAAAVFKMLGNKDKISDDELRYMLSDDKLCSALNEIREQHSKAVSKNMRGNQHTKGMHHSDEVKRRISESNKKPHGVHPRSEWKKGHVPHNKGKDYSKIYTDAERRDKFGVNVGRKHITNGRDHKMLKPGEEMPDGYYFETWRKGQAPSNKFVGSEKFLSIDQDEYIKMCRSGASAADIQVYFNISPSNRRQLEKHLGIHRNKYGISIGDQNAV